MDCFYRLSMVGALTLFFLYIIKFSPGFAPNRAELVASQIPVEAPLEVSKPFQNSHRSPASVSRGPANVARGPASVSDNPYMGFTQAHQRIKPKVQNQVVTPSGYKKMNPKVVNNSYKDEVDRVVGGEHLLD